MPNDHIQRDEEAAYWQEFQRGKRVASDMIGGGVSRKAIRELAEMSVELEPYDHAYWAGVMRAARIPVLSTLADLWRKLPTFPTKARSQ